MKRNEFETRLTALVRHFGQVRDNVGCVQCLRCEGCQGCTFCEDSKRLVRSHYCVTSSDCTDCAHCRQCTGCLGCVHCIASDRCLQSAYVIRSVNLSGCTYCFGCVGLSRKDFHILNEPYDRKSYFALTKQLSQELGLA